MNVIDFYLDPTKPSDVQGLVAKGLVDAALAPKDELLLQGYVLEALRACPDIPIQSVVLTWLPLPGINPTFRGVYRTSAYRLCLAVAILTFER